MMGSYVTITVRGCDEETLEEGVRAAFTEMQRLAGILSEWDPGSPVSRVSAKAGVAPVAVPPELMQVLSTSQEVAALTNGALDVTWAALADLWHFEGPPVLPKPEEVARRRALVDHRDLIVDTANGTAFLRRQGMRLGLGGVAKGYIAAAGAQLLVERGIRDALVAASGDITARGQDGEQPWRVAIEDPRNPDRSVASVELHDQSISTAGDYEHCFFIDGRRYHHILDPKTGYPASGTASVSVLSDSGLLADALDTGLLVMGTRAGSEVVARLPRIGALFVDEGGKIRTAGALGNRFELGSQPSPARPDDHATGRVLSHENQAGVGQLN
jgi:thiamine biosynthesis lipoprotein